MPAIPHSTLADFDGMVATANVTDEIAMAEFIRGLTDAADPALDHVDLIALHEFLSGTLARLYARQVSDLATATWCPDWWRHPEAVERLWLLFLLRTAATDAESRSTWWDVHARPHMEALMDPAGPFKYCSVRHGHTDMLKPLPFNPPPASAAA
ncbi:DUF4913 domain-containing protein [Nocardia paucivorans]|uniref:DUF4913 domain-containing protein n=1 Tax=Nocardia paucivorans TaxID=114259 RepID=UPI0002F756C6|nr:DUF4913 domain-containing protein [Nocardia paucivorans]